MHFGSHDHNGGVAVFFCGGSTKPTPCPNVGGTVTGTWVPADVVGPNAQGIEPGAFDELVAAIRAGHTYANVHTTRWPNGEIRGQVNNANQRERPSSVRVGSSRDRGAVANTRRRQGSAASPSLSSIDVPQGSVMNAIHMSVFGTCR